MDPDSDERREGMLRLAVISAQRARLRRGTPAWRAKLREEERLLANIRVLARRSSDPIEPSIALDDDLGFEALEDEVDEDTVTQMDASGADGQQYGG
jgi:hypothetical protein